MGAIWSSTCYQLLVRSCSCLCGRLSTPVHLCYLSPSHGLSNWGFRLPMRGSGYVHIVWAGLHVSRCMLGSLGRTIKHVLTSWNCMLFPTRFLQNSRHRALEWVYLTTNLELMLPTLPPSTRICPNPELCLPALGQICRFLVFQAKSPRTPVMQDSSLEELEALPEEMAGGDEDREKEILMERIQSIKEEKQVSCACSANTHLVPAST